MYSQNGGGTSNRMFEQPPSLVKCLGNGNVISICQHYLDSSGDSQSRSTKSPIHKLCRHVVLKYRGGRHGGGAPSLHPFQMEIVFRRVTKMRCASDATCARADGQMVPVRGRGKDKNEVCKAYIFSTVREPCPFPLLCIIS